MDLASSSWHLSKCFAEIAVVLGEDLCCKEWRLAHASIESIARN